MSQIRFGACILDPQARRLHRDGQPMHLSTKAFELLCILVSERPNAFTKADLHKRIWPDVFVTDDSLSKLVSEIRTAIGDNPRKPAFLRTVHGFGYAFSSATEIGPVMTSGSTPATPCLIVEGRAFALAPGDNIIGRDPSARISLDSLQVSRQHARVRVGDLHVTLEDLESRNGTSVNGERITGAVLLSNGDKIVIAPFTLHFWTSAESVQTEPTDVRS
jgi:DNA-binding winged helix-turn-helix (wHTH) protein